MPISADVYSQLNTNAPMQLSQLLQKQNDPARQMQTVLQLMQLKKMQQEMQQAPEDRQIRDLERKAKISELEAHAQERGIKTAASGREQALFQVLRSTDSNSPEYKQAWTELQILKAPQTAFKEPDAQKLPWYVSRRPDGKISIDPAYADFEAMKANKGGTKISMPPPVTPVTIQDPNNPNATIIIDGRTRQVLGAGPKLTETGRGIQKQMTASQGMGKDLQMAEDLLMGQVRDSEGNVIPGNKPTSSLIGKGTDFLGSVVGYSPSGAAEAKSLEVVGGRLVQKVPRFEGPQSDKDVALYKSMAADVANAGLPIETRLASLRTMREIYAGYEDGSRGRVIQNALTNQGSGKDIAPPAPTSKPREVTMEDVFQAAKKTGKSLDQVKKDAVAKGYTIRGM